ncbi:MAG: PKD domain-containing protein, partial [Actinomycetota bacterium]
MTRPDSLLGRFSTRVGVSPVALIAGALSMVLAICAIAVVTVANASSGGANGPQSVNVVTTANQGGASPAASPTPVTTAKPKPSTPARVVPIPSLRTAIAPVLSPTPEPQGVTYEPLPADPTSAVAQILHTSPPASTLATPQIVEAQTAARSSTTEPAGEFGVDAEAGYQSDASATWTIDFGDGSSPSALSVPAQRCPLAGAPVNNIGSNAGMPDHRYNAPGTYTITVSIRLTGCDGSTGPAATTSFS